MKFMQLTAVLNKVNLSCILLTHVEHEGVFQFMVSLTFHIHEEYDNFIRDKIPISACLVRGLSQLLNLGCNAVVFYIVTCFLVFHTTFASYCLSHLNLILLETFELAVPPKV